MKSICTFAVACLFFAFGNTYSTVSAQSPLTFAEPQWQGPARIYLVQGERRKLSDDFVAELDGDNLSLELETRGLLSAVEEQDLLVTLIQPSGERKDQRVDADGKLVFSGVQTGLAAIVVTADSLANTSISSLYAAIPFFVSPATDETAEPQPLLVPTATVEPQRLASALNEELEEPTIDAEIMEAREFEVVSYSRFRVQRLADGSVQGRVVVPQRGYLALPGPTNLTFQRDGMPVASTTSNEVGEFLVENVPIGVNSIVATGRAGHAAYSVEVVEFEDTLVNPLTGGQRRTSHFVSTNQAVANSMIVCLIPPALMDDVREVVNERIPQSIVENVQPSEIAGEPVLGEPLAGTPGPGSFPGGGGFGGGGFGGGFGGGGGGFGGGGAAGLAGIAGLAAVAVALSDDDDDATLFPPIASPIVR